MHKHTQIKTFEATLGGQTFKNFGFYFANTWPLNAQATMFG